MAKASPPEGQSACMSPEWLDHVSVPFGTKLALGICFVVTLGAGIAPDVVVSLTDHGRPYLVEAPAPTPPPAGSASGSGS